MKTLILAFSFLMFGLPSFTSNENSASSSNEVISIGSDDDDDGFAFYHKVTCSNGEIRECYFCFDPDCGSSSRKGAEG